MPYVTGVVAAAGSYLGGPVVGAALGAIGSEANYYVGATAARAKGLHGRDARHKGVLERKRSAYAAIVGVGVGTTAAVAAGALGLAGTGAGGNAVAGTAGSHLLFGATPASQAASTGFVTAGNLASQPSS